MTEINKENQWIWKDERIIQVQTEVGKWKFSYKNGNALKLYSAFNLKSSFQTSRFGQLLREANMYINFGEL